jgi:hypothetical protein
VTVSRLAHLRVRNSQPAPGHDRHKARNRRRSGRWWAISVPELKGVHTQARRLDQAEAMAREAIALMLDADPAAIRVAGIPVRGT